MKKVLAVLSFLIILIVLGLGYLGFVPGLSPLMAKPQDLGVTNDPALVAELDERLGLENRLPAGEDAQDRQPTYFGVQEVGVSLNSQEITSVINAWAEPSQNSPIRDIQVRINPDGSGEISGILSLSAAISTAKQLGYSDDQIAEAQKYASYVAGDLPFYAKAEGGVINNQVTIKPQSVILGRVNLPASITGPVAAAASDAIERKINQVPGAFVEELNFENGQANFKGTAPQKVE